MRKKMYLFLLPILLSYQAVSQNFAHDILLIRNSGRSSIPSTAITSSFYSKTIQAQLSKSCVYEMKCGEFTKGVFKEFGPLKGFFLAIDRAGRCTHISTMETLPTRLNKAGKIVEKPDDYRLHQ